MTREQWERVVALFEQSLDQQPEERERFVSAAAGPDVALRSQVLAMLRADSTSHSILDGTQGTSPAPPAEVEADAPVEGLRVGAYTILRLIGRGGMASVFLATDAKHHRQVALKVMDAETSSVIGGERFRREIECVAQLRHPHILPLYDSGEAEGRLFYVMPFITGETLRERIERQGPFPIDDVRRIVAEIGGALDYAHRNGVVHRDVKPENILLDEGHAIVADFGVAHRALGNTADTLTAAGVIIGTPAYMSPEQALGHRDLDARSDVYALACVVYEMLAGVPPYHAATRPALVMQHISAPVPTITDARSRLASAVDDVLRKALAKNPGERFATTHEFVHALDRALGAAPAADVDAPHAAVRSGAGRGPERPRRLARPVIAALGMVAVLGAAVTFFATRDAEPPSIAVLPFTNMSVDRTNEYFSDGVTEELIGALAQLGRVRVIPRTTVFAYKGRTGDIRRIGGELGATRVIEGSVRREEDRVLVNATMYDAETGERIWSDRYERDWGSVLVLQTEIAGAIAERLQLDLLPGERARLAGRHTVNADAYDSYLRGRHFFDIRTSAALEQAAVHFQRALDIDSTYARAYAGLADTYGISAWTGNAAASELFPRAERAARRALSLDSTLAEAHVSLAIIHTFHHWDWDAGERAANRAIALDSTLWNAWFFRTWPLAARGQLPEALEAIERTQRLEPLSLIANTRVGTVLGWMKRYEEADSVLRRTLEIDPTYPAARVQRARVLSLQGRHAEAIAALPPDSVWLGSYESGIAGFVYARAGRREEALASARALEAREYVPAEGVAVIYAGLGEVDTALDWLERAVESRGVGLIFLAAEPVYESLRDQPRYQRLAQRIGVKR